MARLLTCYKCNQRFPNKKLNIHLNIQHNIKDENLNSFVCEVDDCNRSFSSLKTLNAHSKAQHKVKNDSVETKIDFRYNTREQNLTNDDNEKRNEKNYGAQDTDVKSTVNHNEQTKNSNHVVPQPPYSPDLALCDFWLFSKLKRPLGGHRYDSNEEIKVESKKVLKAIPEIDFKNCFEDWKKRWHKCIVSDGDYFEGYEIDLEE